ncbi:two-component system sensor kinase [Amycolatopsis mediterranei S699]|uniref:histidine kinase n=2 Tax=Amycolatopsis mediterranei TaxID=33910 RepID=A0A0H3DIA3_AMYMU|nr:two-component system sensor kinase [Amycolatopsis mediterranei U32]AEK47626.1 two-component system sensor kinase [Amycolatopsis mediterranei S699]AGT89455.1 two-component system sensor kinase [Amycolatopsis mediterranei RB]KDO12386.1 histidine kinase [Amycolatopsis mediterranei]AFO82326.1 two-component system sensor kinase [Amycolatopsis mediterranei S699]
MRRPWSLRRRLIVQLAALLALVCLVVGVVTEFALSEFLVGQQDKRLAAASDRAAHAGDRPPPWTYGEAPPPDPLRVLGQGEGTLAVVQVRPGASPDAGVLDSSVVGVSRRKAPFKGISKEQTRALLALPSDGKQRSIDLGGSLGEYRVVSTTSPRGDKTVIGLPLKDVNETLWQLGFILGGVALAGILVAGAVGAATIRRTMQPLDRLAATATRVSELPLDRGEVALSERVPEADTDPNTEVGKVGSALNRMLQHVANALTARHASENRVRQFVADASHELRTPLAAIRGYAELTRRGGEQVPPDVAFAMSRVESESRRMTTLVEDLLLLARLDSGRPVVHEWVDLCRLVADAVADAHVAGPDHKWLMDVPGEPIGVRGDAGQLHQVVINVLANARTHTPPGTTVTTTLSTSDGMVRLRVADDGPGIPPEILPDIFERFARGDNSRSRAAGSTGLGLAIVAAVVAAHGGRVGVQSRPGRTEFEITFRAAAPQ